MYRSVHTSMWFDPKIRGLVKAKKGEAVYLFLYLFASHLSFCERLENHPERS